MMGRMLLLEASSIKQKLLHQDAATFLNIQIMKTTYAYQHMIILTRKRFFRRTSQASHV